MNGKYIDFLAQELEKNKLVIFVGAGVSMNSGLPNWKNLVKKFANGLGIEKENYTSEEFLEIPEIYYNTFGKIRYYEILETEFNNSYLPNSVHDTLKKLDLNYVITTNYDNLIEDSLNKEKKYDIIKKEEELAYSKSNKMIIKMHGDIENRNTVLKKSDYDAYEEKFPLITTFIKGLFTTNTVMFIGYSLNDINVKNIMKWISDILKEDFRRVYLVDFCNDDILKNYQNKDNKLVNRILLQDSEGKNRGILLKEFLEELLKKKEEKIKCHNIKIYKNLDYLTEDNLKKIEKKIVVDSYETNSEGLIIHRSIKVSDELLRLKDFKDIILKSKISSINKISIEDFFKEDKQIKEKIEQEARIDEIIETIIFYDEEKFNLLMQESLRIENRYIIVCGYLFFKKVDESGKKVEELINKFRYKETDKEKLIWAYFILYNIQLIKSYISFNYESEIIDLKKIYNTYYPTITSLYEEIFDDLTFQSAEKKMEDCLYKVRKGKRSVYSGGQTPMEKAQYLVRDIFNYSVLNGIEPSSGKLNKIIKKYIEIVLISYTNEINIKKGNRANKLERFQYFDLYIMLQLDIKDLEMLFSEYSIKKIKCEEGCSDNFLLLLKNILKLSMEEDCFKNNIKINLSEKILLIISKIELNKQQVREVINILVNDNSINKLYSENVFYKKISNGYIKILYYNMELIDKIELKKIIYKIITSKDIEDSNEDIIKFLIDHFFEKTSEKLRTSVELIEYLNKNNRKIKVLFLKVLEKDLLEKIKNEIINSIKKDFDINLYQSLLHLNYIKANSDLEKIFFNELDRVFDKEFSYSYLAEEIFYIIFDLLSSNLVTEEFKINIKKYSNPMLDLYLEKRDYKNIWSYFLKKDDFQFSQFKLEDFSIFTKVGMKKVLEEGVNSKEFMELIKKYVFLKNEDNKIIKAYLEFIDK